MKSEELLLKASFIFDSRFAIACKVDFDLGKPYWWRERILLLSRYHINRLLMIFSKVFPNTLVREIWVLLELGLRLLFSSIVGKWMFGIFHYRDVLCILLH